MPPLSHLADPLASGIILSLGFAENGPRTMDHQGAQISVAAFADPEQPGLPAARPLPWNQSKPGGKLASVLETIPVTDRRYQRRCGDRSIALDAERGAAVQDGDADLELGDLSVEVPCHEPLAQDFDTMHLRLDAAPAVVGWGFWSVHASQLPLWIHEMNPSRDLCNRAGRESHSDIGAPKPFQQRLQDAGLLLVAVNLLLPFA